MALLGIQERRIGDDCIEVSFPGEATADAVERSKPPSSVPAKSAGT